MFKGIPYAAPVSGLDRWRPPQPRAVRDGVFDARAYGPACPQSVTVVPMWMLSDAGQIMVEEIGGMSTLASEAQSPDCLRLNIWTPSARAAPQVASADARPPGGPAPGTVDSTRTTPADDAQPTPDTEPAKQAQPGLPVIVFLHGGGLSLGSSNNKSIEGTRLARKGAVVVTINYRIGPMGFLAADGLFDGDVLAGNRGVMDTVAALKWIQANIAAFGGDPGRVTLMGQSGGGTNVWGVLASPASKGLVRRAIVQSGPINHVPIADQTALARDVLKDWGVPVGDADALAAVPMDKATSTIMQTKLVGSDTYGAMSRTYLPTTAAYGTAFLPDDVFTAVQKGRLDGVDILVGSNADDGRASIVAVPIPDPIAIDMWNGYIGGLIAPTKAGEAERLEQYKAAMPGADDLTVKLQLQTDALYRVPVLKAADLHSARPEGATFVYQFDWKSPAAGGKVGAMHGMDTVFAFGNLHAFPRALGTTDGAVDPALVRLSDAVGTAFVQFAATGKPTADGLPTWPAYDTGARQTMVFDTPSRVQADPGGALRALWD